MEFPASIYGSWQTSIGASSFQTGIKWVPRGIDLVAIRMEISLVEWLS